jgi:hypothetical protein
MIFIVIVIVVNGIHIVVTRKEAHRDRHYYGYDMIVSRDD